jgi:hypothetical protein
MAGARYYIPTRGRVGRQLTLSGLPAGLLPFVTLVCPQDEMAAHATTLGRELGNGLSIVSQPDHITTIGAKREWIYKELALKEEQADFAWQFDDDLTFKVITPGGLFRKPVDDQLYDVFTYIEKHYWLELAYQVVGLGTSYFAPKGGIKDDYHLGFAFGCSRKAIDTLEMNRLDVFEDIDYTLQFLRAGMKLGVCYDAVVDQKQPDAPGGVTGERNNETIRRDLERLISYHPGIVSEKPLRPGAHPAAITKVAWKKAAKEGKAKRELQV